MFDMYTIDIIFTLSHRSTHFFQPGLHAVQGWYGVHYVNSAIFDRVRHIILYLFIGFIHCQCVISGLSWGMRHHSIHYFRHSIKFSFRQEVELHSSCECTRRIFILFYFIEWSTTLASLNTVCNGCSIPYWLGASCFIFEWRLFAIVETFPPMLHHASWPQCSPTRVTQISRPTLASMVSQPSPFAIVKIWIDLIP